MTAPILIIDDDPAIRRLVRGTLERQGHGTDEAGTGAEGLEAARRSGCELVLLDLGADDYVTKPFDTAELLARVRVARRHLAGSQLSGPVELGPVTYDADLHRVSRAGAAVHLTPKEYALFAQLARHAGRVLTHQHLLSAVWGPAHTDDIEYLRVTMRARRRKLELDPGHPVLLINEPGIGYRLDCE